MWTRKEIKRSAKTQFKANYWSCVFVVFVMALFIGTGGIRVTVNLRQSLPGMVNNSAEDGSSDSLDNLDKYMQDNSEVLSDPDAGVEDILNGVGLSTTDNTENDKGSEDASSGIISTGVSEGAGFGFLYLLIGIFIFGSLEIGCYSFFYRNTDRTANVSELGGIELSQALLLFLAIYSSSYLSNNSLIYSESSSISV